MGLVTRVAADETVTREAFALSESLAGEAAGALAGAKRLIRSSWEATRAESAADEVETIASAVTSPEAQERLERFDALTGVDPRARQTTQNEQGEPMSLMTRSSTVDGIIRRSAKTFRDRPAVIFGTAPDLRRPRRRRDARRATCSTSA